MESVSSGEMLDLAAFDRLFGEYRPRFIRFAASYVTDAAVAEDIVMESFMAAWERRALLSERSLPPYVLVIVRNKCLNHLRARQVRLRAEEHLHSHGARMLELRISTSRRANPRSSFRTRPGGWLTRRSTACPTVRARSSSAAASAARATRRLPPLWERRSRASSSKSRRRCARCASRSRTIFRFSCFFC